MQVNIVMELGLIVGIVLLIGVSACAYLLARKAARSVDQFREEHHEIFLGGKKP